MKLTKNIFYSLLFFIAGWLFNFIFDVQFALGFIAGWLMREGYNNLAQILQNMIN